MSTTDLALFGHTSFWEAEALLRRLRGVLHTTAGYTGGTHAHPTYHAKGDHTEAVRVVYSRQRTTFEELARLFAEKMCMPVGNGLGYDDKTLPIAQPTIFYLDDHQKEVGHNVQRHIIQLWPEAGLRVAPAGIFHPAEGYHQQFLHRLQHS